VHNFCEPVRDRDDRVLPVSGDARRLTFACAVNGAGSITLTPLGSFVLDGGTPTGPPLAMGAAWFGISTASAPATIFEFE
jgi:hypothetical protein